MKSVAITLTSALLFAALVTRAQQPTQPQLKVDSSNRTLTVTATESVTVEPDLAILHIGFVTLHRTPSPPMPMERAPPTPSSPPSSRPESRDRDPQRVAVPRSRLTHQAAQIYVLHQQWTVKVAPARAAEILDIAITAGATNSGQIDWTVKDEKALESQALDNAAARAKANAEVLAKGMGVRLGSLIYVSNQVSSPQYPRPMPMMAMAQRSPRQPATTRHRTPPGQPRSHRLRRLRHRVVLFGVAVSETRNKY